MFLEATTVAAAGGSQLDFAVIQSCCWRRWAPIKMDCKNVFRSAVRQFFQYQNNKNNRKSRKSHCALHQPSNAAGGSPECPTAVALFANCDGTKAWTATWQTCVRIRSRSSSSRAMVLVGASHGIVLYLPVQNLLERFSMAYYVSVAITCLCLTLSIVFAKLITLAPAMSSARLIH